MTIRLLDPPLHEFLPDPDDLPEGPQQRPRVGRCRRSTRCSARAACGSGSSTRDLRDAGPGDHARAPGRCASAPATMPHVEVMVPLVDYERELELMRELRRAHRRTRRAWSTGRLHGRDDDRAAARVLPGRPDRRARRLLLLRHQRPHADRAGLLPRRHRGQDPRALHRPEDLRPLAVRDASTRPASGRCVRMGAWLGRKTKPDLKLGVCGEHGGDPDSIDFFHHSGIDYVSCRPTACRSRASPPRRRPSAPRRARRGRRPPPRPRAAGRAARARPLGPASSSAGAPHRRTRRGRRGWRAGRRGRRRRS